MAVGRVAYRPTPPGSAPMRRPHLGLRRADSGLERGDVVRAVLPQAVDEERRGARDAAEVGRLDVLRDPGLVNVLPHLAVEALHVEVELLGVARHVDGTQL